MSLQRIVIDTPVLTANGFKSVCPFGIATKYADLQNLQTFIAGVYSGQYSARMTALVGAVAAAGTITSTGAATAAQAMTLLNVTLTAVASGPTANQFVLSATPATQATNIAAAINASASFAGKVTATALAGVVTVTSVVPGTLGNGLQIAVGTLTNVSVGAFASGADGTQTIISFL